MLEVKHVFQSYVKGRQKKEVLHDVSFNCPRGEDIAIIGESGSGKPTLGRLVLGIEKPKSGVVLLDGKPVDVLENRSGKMSAVFQNYTSSLHPYFSVKQLIEEPLIHAEPKMPSKQRLSRIMNLLEDVGLDESYLKRYPKMLSGGEAQRIAIARSISTYPNYIMLDEAISSLDMSIQVQILDLLKYLKEKHQLSYIFITHDIQTAVYLCKKIIVFKEGKIQETLMREVLYQSDNKYVKQLLNKQLMD